MSGEYSFQGNSRPDIDCGHSAAVAAAGAATVASAAGGDDAADAIVEKGADATAPFTNGAICFAPHVLPTYSAQLNGDEKPDP